MGRERFTYNMPSEENLKTRHTLPTIGYSRLPAGLADRGDQPSRFYMGRN